MVFTDMIIDRYARRFPAGKPILAILVLLLTGASASADPGSLLATGTYPAASCEKPLKPFTPLQLNNSSEALQYQMTIERYNKAAQTYTDCINAYLATAVADVARIQAQMDAAVASANAP